MVVHAKEKGNTNGNESKRCESKLRLTMPLVQILTANGNEERTNTDQGEETRYDNHRGIHRQFESCTICAQDVARSIKSELLISVIERDVVRERNDEENGT